MTFRIRADERCRVELTVNGRRRAGEAEPRMLLADFLRHELQVYRRACRLRARRVRRLHDPARRARGAQLHAVRGAGGRRRALPRSRGLRRMAALNALQRAFTRHHALQCGFCTARDPDVRHPLPRQEPAPDRGRGARHAVGPHLPLHRLCVDRRRDSRRRARRREARDGPRHRLRLCGPAPARRGSDRRRRPAAHLRRMVRRDPRGRGRPAAHGPARRRPLRRGDAQPPRDGDALLGEPAARPDLHAGELARERRRDRLLHRGRRSGGDRLRRRGRRQCLQPPRRACACRGDRMVAAADARGDGIRFDDAAPTARPLAGPVGCRRPTPTCLMLYTSGTTGRPKGVPRSHRAELAAGVTQVAHHRYRPGESALGVMPMFHTMGVRSMLSSALLNGKLVCMPDYAPAEVLRLAAAEQLSSLFLVPTMFHDILREPKFATRPTCARSRGSAMPGMTMAPALVEQLPGAVPSPRSSSITTARARSTPSRSASNLRPSRAAPAAPASTR